MLIAGGVGVALLVVAGVAIWYFVFRDTAPPKVDLERASESVKNRSGDAGELDGTWNIDTTIGTFSDFTSTFAGYRVEEELVSIGAKTAFGRTRPSPSHRRDGYGRTSIRLTRSRRSSTSSTEIDRARKLSTAAPDTRRASEIDDSRRLAGTAAPGGRTVPSRR